MKQTQLAAVATPRHCADSVTDVESAARSVRSGYERNGFHMRGFLILVALLFGQQLTADQPYELQGEIPGTTTLTQFREHHNHADCWRVRPAREMSCRVYEDVSFAGVVAHSQKDCSTPECRAQGIFATFGLDDGRMFEVGYGVSPFSSNEILAVLKREFGEPNTERETPVNGQLRSFIWENSSGSLSLVDKSIRGSDGTDRPIATVIYSSLPLVELPIVASVK